METKQSPLMDPGAGSLRYAHGGALLAAFLFGAAAPAAKVLVGEIRPVLLAGLLYLGCGLALAPAALVPGRRNRFVSRDLGYLAGAIVSGGIVAPLALLWGLSRVSASSASLLLNFEAIFTALLASVFFREPIGRRMVVALALLTMGGWLAGGSEGGSNERFGLVLVTVACLGWALDNNLTREVAHLDARVIAMTKGIVAGSANTLAALALGSAMPALPALVGALFVGALGYGASLVLFVGALGALGASRTSALFATAPFFGASLGIVALGEPLRPALVAGGVLMGLGVATMLRERHRHLHRHHAIEHSHRHVHDEHHRHVHEDREGAEPHTHRHRHEPLLHEHAHLPDLHHRHRHAPEDDECKDS